MDDTDFTARKRPFAPVHRRSLELQQLDALLRIEELLQRQAPGHTDLMISPEAIDAATLNAVIPDAAKAPKRTRK
jgi:hypothetical protein